MALLSLADQYVYNLFINNVYNINYVQTIQMTG